MMKIKVVDFFATKSDIEPILQLVEEKEEIKYVECGLFFEQIENSFRTWREIPNLGVSIKGDINFEPCYLVVKDDTKIVIRTVPQRTGGVRYAIDGLKNPESAYLKLGGVYQNNFALIGGQIGGTLDNLVSNELFYLFSKIIKKQFLKIQGYYLGQEANQLFENGSRLTNNIKSPSLYDLKKG